MLEQLSAGREELPAPAWETVVVWIEEAARVPSLVS
jgi:hypothetical protein